MQEQQQARKHTRMFTASEIAEFEYCPLTWWHEQFEPWARAESNELFARLVELENEQGTQAPALPEYRMIEQLLLRRGAFDEGQYQHQQHAEAVENVAAEIEEERRQHGQGGGHARRLATTVVVLGILAFVLLIFGLLLR